MFAREHELLWQPRGGDNKYWDVCFVRSTDGQLFYVQRATPENNINPGHISYRTAKNAVTRTRGLGDPMVTLSDPFELFCWLAEIQAQPVPLENT